MGTIYSSMFQQRRDEDMPDGNSVGSGQNTDLEGSITESVEIEARNCPTHNTDQLESKSKRRDTREAQAQKDGSDAPKRGKKRGARTESNVRKKTKRSKNWTLAETQTLIGSRLQPSLDKEKSEWEAISVQIPGRTGKQCQQRWDIVVRPYKKIKRHCDAHGKEFGQITEEEFRIMNVDFRCWRDNNWYNMIEEYHLRLSSGRVSHDLNGASASTCTILGENDALPSGLVTTAFPTEQREPTAAAIVEGAADLDTMEPPASTSMAVSDADGTEDPVSYWRKVLLDSAE